MNRISELLSLNAEQQKLIDIDNDYVVQAGAGSGKTRVLVSRYLRILESGRADINQIVAITFTINAASEMKERIRLYVKHYIDRFGETANIVSGSLKDISDSPISTIHGFAARIIRENPYECNINSKIKILEGLDRKLFVEQTIDDYLTKHCSKDKNVTEIFENENYDYASVRIKIKEILELISRHHISPSERLIEKKDIQGQIKKLFKRLSKEIYDGPYGSKNSKIDLRIKDFNQIINKLENCKLRNDKISLLDKGKTILSHHGSRKGILELKISSDIERRYAASCVEIINQIINLYELENSNCYLKLFLKFHEFYKEKKRANGYLEFEDLLQIALRLLKNNPEILSEYKNKYKFFLIDEFQDTDKIQYELINLFSISSNRFIVGDPKQSIFGFRGAVPQIFKSLQTSHSKSVLTYNYRSDYRLINFYNELFKIIIKQSYEEMNFVSSEHNGAVVKEVIYSLINNGNSRVLTESSTVGKKISELVASGYKNKDIAILMRSKSHIDSFESALSQLSIPYYSSEEAGFYRYQEIRDIVSFLKYIVNENDKISQACVLRSTFVGATDTELFNHYVKQDSAEIIGNYLKFVLALREKSLSLNPLELLLYILNKTIYWPAMLALADGQKKYDSIIKLIEIFSLLQLQGKNLSEIINFLDLSYEENTEGLSQLELDESDTVKILTVHKAKGLEFPVVILADINHGMGGGAENVGYSDKYGFVIRNKAARSSIWKDMVSEQRDLTFEEEKRLLYVAMTRAREKLILSVCSDTRVQKGSYLDILNAVMPLSKIQREDTAIKFKDYQIPVTCSDNIKVSDPLVITEMKYKAETVNGTAPDLNTETKPRPTQELTVPNLSINLNNIQKGSIMHRFLQIWNFEHMSIENTIQYVLNESYTIDIKMHGLLKTLAENFLNSDIFQQIKSADEFKRELPFYIELDGKSERRKIDLLIFKDGNISMFDYKLSRDIKQEYIEQMDLYEKALLKRYSCNNINKNLVHIPDVIIKNIN
jgi:ATP-dependent helicase/nuclease subunit A